MTTRIRYMPLWHTWLNQLRIIISLSLLMSSFAWAITPDVEQIRHSIILDVDTHAEQMIAVGERGYIMISSDRGKSWIVGKTSVSQTLTAVFMLDDKHAWAVGHDGIIIVSEDGGLHWRMQRSHQLVAQQNLDDEPGFGPLMDVWFSDQNEGFAVGAYGQFMYTDDGGMQWRNVAGSLDNIDEYHLNAIIPADPGLLVIAAEAGLAFISTDIGKSWQRRQMPYDVSLFGAAYNPVINSNISSVTTPLYLFGLQGYLFRSDDQGKSWQVLKTGINSPLYKSSLDSDGGMHFFGGDGVILSTWDQGNTFSQYKYEDRRVITGGTIVDDLFFLVGQVGLHTLESSSVSSTRIKKPVTERDE